MNRDPVTVRRLRRTLNLLAAEYLPLMPFQKIPIWPPVSTTRVVDFLAMQIVIDASIVLFGAQSIAYLKLVVSGNGDIASVKQSMQIASQKEPVVDPVLPTPAVRHNVCGFKRGQRVLLCNRTCTFVRLANLDTKQAFFKARTN
jgi:hypothetical protein